MFGGTARTANVVSEYLKTAESQFQDKPEIYYEFLKAMNDFKAERVDLSGLILRVKELFKGKQELILGFNNFFPKSFQIIEDDQPLPKKPVEFGKLLVLSTRLRQRFKTMNRTYISFLVILNMYRDERKTLFEVCQEMDVLFRDHQDLLMEFNHFLPDTSATASITPYDTYGVISRVKELFDGNRDLISGFSAFLPKGFQITEDDQPLPNKTVEFGEAFSSVDKVKDKEGSNKDNITKAESSSSSGPNFSSFYTELYVSTDISKFISVVVRITALFFKWIF